MFSCYAERYSPRDESLQNVLAQYGVHAKLLAHYGVHVIVFAQGGTLQSGGTTRFKLVSKELLRNQQVQSNT